MNFEGLIERGRGTYREREKRVLLNKLKTMDVLQKAGRFFDKPVDRGRGHGF